MKFVKSLMAAAATLGKDAVEHHFLPAVRCALVVAARLREVRQRCRNDACAAGGPAVNTGDNRQ